MVLQWALEDSHFRRLLRDPPVFVICPMELHRRSHSLRFDEASCAASPEEDAQLIVRLRDGALRLLEEFASRSSSVLRSPNKLLTEWAEAAHEWEIILNCRYSLADQQSATGEQDIPVYWRWDFWPPDSVLLMPSGVRQLKRLARGLIESWMDRLVTVLKRYPSVTPEVIAEAVRPYYKSDHALPWRLRSHRRRHYDAHVDEVGLLLGVAARMESQNSSWSQVLEQKRNRVRRLPRKGREIRAGIRQVWKDEAPPIWLAPPASSSPCLTRRRVPDPPIVGLTDSEARAIAAYAEAFRRGYARWAKKSSLRALWGKSYESRRKNMQRARKRSPAVEQWFLDWAVSADLD